MASLLFSRIRRSLDKWPNLERAYSREEARCLAEDDCRCGWWPGGSGSRAVALHEVSMAQGNTYPVVGSASLESRRLPSVAPPTHDTTFDSRTPPMPGYYYHRGRSPPSSSSTLSPMEHLSFRPNPRIGPRRSHSFRGIWDRILRKQEGIIRIL